MELCRPNIKRIFFVLLMYKMLFSKMKQNSSKMFSKTPQSQSGMFSKSSHFRNQPLSKVGNFLVNVSNMPKDEKKSNGLELSH